MIKIREGSVVKLRETEGPFMTVSRVEYGGARVVWFVGTAKHEAMFALRLLEPIWWDMNSPETIAKSVKSIIDEIEPQPRRLGLKETPDRVARYWHEVTKGYTIDVEETIKSFTDGADGCDELIFEGAIPFHSNCEHHMVPFFGVAHVGYIPNGAIVGLSKLGRVVDIFARRLQVQERLTNEIANALDEYIVSEQGKHPRGVGVVLRARHLCVESRGVGKVGAVTITSALRGVLKTDASARAEFLTMVEMADRRVTNL